MGSQKNKLFWDCFPAAEDGHLHCKFCGLKLAATTPVLRLKLHLGLIPHYGVEICTRPPSEVQKAAYEAIIHHENKRSKRRRFEIASSSRGKNTVAENQARDVEMEGVSAQTMGPAAEEGRNPSFVGTETPGYNVNEVLIQPPAASTFADTGHTTGQAVPGNAAYVVIENPSEHTNEVSMQTPAASTFAGGHGGNDVWHITGQLMPQFPENAFNDAIMSANMMQPVGDPFAIDEDSVSDWENFFGEPPAMQPPVGTVPQLEAGESSMANMNSQLVNQVQGVTIDECREVYRAKQVSQPVEGLQFSENGGIAAEDVSGELIHQVAGDRTVGDRGDVMENMTEGLVPSVGGGRSADDLARGSESMTWEQTIQLSENRGIAAENISGEVAGGRTAGDRGDVMENMTAVPVPSVGGGRSADDRGRDSENMIEDQMIQPVGRVACAEGPDSIVHQTKGDALLTEKLIGKAFQRNQRRIWEYLTKDEILRIGICGMGGAGKTTLVTHIYNQLLNMPNPFRSVYWVTVSQDFSIHKLQSRVSRAIGVDLSDEDDERKRAAKLFKELESRERSVLILDDLWDPFSLVKVGIPIGVNGCKLILTTRSFEICKRMDCQEKIIIKVEPLCEEEAWKLFLETLGHGLSLTPEITEVAKGITKECGGLPLAIITMAGTMKGVDHICEWKTAFEKLKESEAGERDMDKDVFRVLKFSYDRLSSTLKQCFLHCALFPEDFQIASADLIRHLIAVGIIKGKRSMWADLDEGLAVLNKLKQACLLEDSTTFSGAGGVKMHDLVRDMAVQILRVDCKAMVEAGKKLEELPDEENWKEDLVTVSLMENYFNEIPSAYSPNCPNLSTLLLCDNEGLKLISRSFFEKLNGLKILDLSYTGIEELPDSVSELVNLTSLLLQRCTWLKRVPSLAKLKALKKLDLSNSGIEEIPHGMEFLSNLVDLDLHDTRLPEQFPIGILPRLSKLQFLDLGEGIAEAREVSSLKRLEVVRVHFSDLHCWNHCIQSLEGLRTYSFLLAPREVKPDNVGESMVSKILARENEVRIEQLDNINQVGSLALPKDVHELRILHCHELKSLYTAFAFSLHHATQLKELSVSRCNGIEWLHYNLPESLENLWIINLRNLCSLLSEDGGVAQLRLSKNVIFSNLKQFKIKSCPRMKELFPPHLLPNLRNLEELEVVYCENMVKIIGNGPESSVCRNSTPTPVDFALPKLKALNLGYLPALKSICSGGGKLICSSLQNITVRSCWELKRMPISLPFVELNGQLSPPSSLQKINIWPREWWDSVEWGHPYEKGALQPLVLVGRWQ